MNVFLTLPSKLILKNNECNESINEEMNCEHQHGMVGVAVVNLEEVQHERFAVVEVAVLGDLAAEDRKNSLTIRN